MRSEQYQVIPPPTAPHNADHAASGMGQRLHQKGRRPKPTAHGQLPGLRETETPVRVDVRTEVPGDEAGREAGTHDPIRKNVALL